MKKACSLFMAIVMIVACLTVPTVASAKEVQVLPGDGLAQAVRGAQDGDVLLLGDGNYYITETLTIDKPITIKAQSGASPVITGSHALTGWAAVDNGIYRAPYSDTTIPMLIENGETATIARFPNKPDSANFSGGYLFATKASKQTLMFKETDMPQGLAQSLTPSNLQVVGWGDAGSNYANTALHVTDITTTSVTFDGVMKYGTSSDTRFYIRGDKALIDEPGEYALGGDGYIYYYPYNAANLSAGNVTASSAFGNVIEITGSGARIEGVAFKGTALGTFKTDVSHSDYVVFNNDNVAIKITGSENTIEDCEFDGIGSAAIVVNGLSNAVKDSSFQNIGSNAIMVSGSNHVIDNNLITKTCTENGGSAAVSVSGNNNKVSHNEIHDNPRWGINMGRGNYSGNVIEYNDLYNCNTDSSDTGLIYFDHTVGKNEVRYNKVHDSYIYGGMGMGIYMDDDCGFIEIYGNAVYNLKAANRGYVAAPILIKGWENKVYNNVIASCQTSTTGAAGNIFIQKLGSERTTRDNVFYNNAFYNNPAASKMYFVTGVSASTAVKSCDKNLYYPSGAVMSNGSWDFDKNSVLTDTDPFWNGVKGDFGFADNTLLSDLGFQELPLDEMGRIETAHATLRTRSVEYVPSVEGESNVTIKNGDRIYAGVSEIRVNLKEALTDPALFNKENFMIRKDGKTIDGYTVSSANDGATAVLTLATPIEAEHFYTFRVGQSAVTVKGVAFDTLVSSRSYVYQNKDYVLGDYIEVGSTALWLDFIYPISAGTLTASNVKLTKNGAPVTFSSIELNPSTHKRCKLTVPSGTFDTEGDTFVLTLTTGVQTTAGDKASEDSVYTFETSVGKISYGKPEWKELLSELNITIPDGEIPANTLMGTTVEMMNTYTYDVPVVLIVALQDKSTGRVRELSYTEKTIKSRETVTISAGINTPAATGNLVKKVYLWNGIDAMIPLS